MNKVIMTNEHEDNLKDHHIDLIDRQGNITTLTFQNKGINADFNEPLYRGWYEDNGTKVTLSDNIVEMRVY